MKLAIVRQKYTPFGGAERFVERALAALKTQGTDVSIIAREWQGDVQGLRVNPFYLGRTWRDAGFARGVQRIIASGQFDLVQSHERIPGCHIYRAGDGVHATWLDLRNKPFDRIAPWHRYTLAAEAALFRHPNLRAVICNSRMVRDDIARRFGVGDQMLHVIYNGVDLEKFHPGLREKFRVATRNRLGISDEAPVLLFVGSGFARKGVALLLDAFSRLGDRRVQLIVVGGDKRINAFRQRSDVAGLGRQIHFLGPVGDVRPYYAAADGFVLPTMYDPAPNAVLEAMACGLPTVTTSYCGCAEWISDGINGLVVTAGDIEQLADALKWLCAFGQADLQRRAARKTVEGFSLDAMAGRLNDLYGCLGAQA